MIPVLASISALACVATASSMAQFQWTDPPALPAGARNVYVSVDGDNALNDGLSDVTPKANWFVLDGNSAFSLMRYGYGDRMLLKKGDVFDIDGSDVNLRVALPGGDSSDAPMMVWTYGTGTSSPVIQNTSINVGNGGSACKHVWIMGVSVVHTVTTDAQGNGVNIIADQCEDMLVEGCFLSGGGINVNIHPNGDSTYSNRMQNVRVRGNVIRHAYATGGGSQGILCGNVYGALLERNDFYHNGWATTDDDQFSHNVYMYLTCQDITFRWNTSSHASNGGFQSLRGCVNEQNIYLNNYDQLVCGAKSGVANKIRYNSINGGHDLGALKSVTGIWHHTEPNGALFAHDDFSDSSGGDVELNHRDWNPSAIARRWNVFGASTLPATKTGLAVANGGLYMKSISADPVYIDIAEGTAQGGGDMQEEDSQFNCVPMDKDKGPYRFYVRANSEYADCYVFELSHAGGSGSGMDTVTIYKRLSNVETVLATADLGVDDWTWGTDVFSRVVFEGVLSAYRGAPSGSGLGELLVTAAAAESSLARTGFEGVVLSQNGARLKVAEIHELLPSQTSETYENILTSKDGIASDLRSFTALYLVPFDYGSIHDNAAWDYGTMFFFTGSATGSVSTDRNVCVLNDTDQETYCFYSQNVLDSHYTFTDNEWYLGFGWTWNIHDGAIRTTDPTTWAADSGETGGVYSVYPSMTPPVTIDPNHAITDYLTSIGETATVARYYEICGGLNPYIPGSGFDVVSFLNWQRAKFSKGPVPSV